MALQLYVSNALEPLADQLREAFQGRKAGVFQPHYVVTQTEGMNNWLKLRIADGAGIAAHIRFLKPNDLIHRAYFLLGGESSESLSSDSLCWLLYRILGEDDFKNRFPQVAAYYSEGVTGKAVKRMALARKVADFFDQYQIYRPEMIEQWNAATLLPFSGGDWQKYLWTRAKKLSAHPISDKTLMGKYILEALKHKEKRALLQARMPEVDVFGLSITTAWHIKIFEALARCLNISFYLLNPAPSEYWLDTISEKQQMILAKKGRAEAGETVVGNTLLASWGRVIKDSFSLLFEYDDFLNTYTEVGVVEPAGNSLLQQIQQDIFYNRPPGEGNLFSLDKVKDGSITIQSCYTIAREVEVLYNFLVHLVDRKKERISPRDIVVMVSDIDAYAPYIKAVFNNAPHTFRFTIADESYTGSDNIINAVKAIMEMSADSFKAEEVVQLLESGYIRRRFELTNTALIRKVVDAANIRFGAEGSRQDDTHYVSWQYGLQRIIYGLCLSGEEEYAVGDDTLFPLEMLEGSEAQELVRFCHFVQVLLDAIDKRKCDRSIAGWVAYVEFLLHNLVYDGPEAEEEEYALLRAQLEKFNLLHAYLEEPVAYEVFCYHFLQSISGVTRAASFAGGGITFCSLIPMRSIPFRVVALLGMNFDKFPRRESPSSFNLMDEERRKGDRNVKENDKHLFLETLLSAQQYLYISYIGQSVKDNSPLPPSALVDELIDYIEAGCNEPEAVRPALLTRQPLHGFSRKYYGKDSRLYTYLSGEESGRPNFFNPDVERGPARFEEVSLNELIGFFKNPFKTYYNKVLGVYFDESSELLSETELFVLDSLQEWELRHELLTLEPDGWEPFKKRLVKTGRLPLKNMAEICLKRVEAEVSPLRELFLQVTGGESVRQLPVEIVLEDAVIRGTLHGVYGTKLVSVCFSKSECKYQLETYIRYLAGIAAGMAEEVYFLSKEKEQVFKGAALSREEARKRLSALLGLYRKGHERIMPFYPDFRIKPADVAQMDRKAFDKMVDGKLNSYVAPCNDHYILREYENGFFNSDVVLEEYKEHFNQLVMPLTRLFPECYQ